MPFISFTFEKFSWSLSSPTLTLCRWRAVHDYRCASVHHRQALRLFTFFLSLQTESFYCDRPKESNEGLKEISLEILTEKSGSVCNHCSCSWFSISFVNSIFIDNKKLPTKSIEANCELSPWSRKFVWKKNSFRWILSAASDWRTPTIQWFQVARLSKPVEVVEAVD